MRSRHISFRAAYSYIARTLIVRRYPAGTSEQRGLRLREYRASRRLLVITTLLVLATGAVALPVYHLPSTAIDSLGSFFLPPGEPVPAASSDGSSLMMPPPTDLFLSEYVEGSSNNKAIEIYNGTGSPVNLTTGTYVLQVYSNGSGTATTTTGLVGTIANGDVFVIANTAAVLGMTPDQLSGNISYNGNDAVVLRQGGAAGTILDVVGQIGNDPGVGGWGTDPTNTTDNTIRRQSAICAGDTNGADAFDPATEWDGFTIDTFAGLGSHTASCGGTPVMTTSPVSIAFGNQITGTTSAAQMVTISNTTGTAPLVWMATITGADASSFSAVAANGSVAIGGSTQVSVTFTPTTAGAKSANIVISGDDLANPSDIIPLSGTGVAPPRIHDLQGATHISPFSGQVVSNVSAIVTAKSSNGFYMQDPAPDANDATSEGIFVFTNVVPIANVGDSVSVTGTVTEFRAGGGSSTNLTITEITSPVISINSTGNPLPAPIVIGTGGRVPPTMVIDDDATGDVETSGSFDHSTDGIDFYESLEGMLVQVNNPVAVDLRNPFGELPVLGDNGAAASLRTVRGGIVLQATDFNPERIILDDQLVAGATPVVNVSDGLSGSAVGVMDYTFGNFKLQLTQALTAVPSGLAPESTAAQTLNQLAVANFNMENLDPGDVARFPLFASQIVNNLQSPDILVVEEIQDNNGPTNDSTVDASVTFNTLISAIITAGGPTYSFRQIDPVDDQDGGEPGGNIRIGFLFRTDRGLAFVDRPGGTSTAATSVIDNGGVPELSFSPGRIDPTNTAFNATRKSLAGEFTFNGQRIYVIGNHFVSRGGDQPLFGRFQPPAMTSDVQRTQQAQIINNFVDSILAVDANAKVIVAGDFNDFEFSAPVNTLEGGVLNNLTESLPANDRYNFIFEGNSQALGHILLSNGAFARFADYDIVHFASEFATQMSDQDPQVARLLLFAGPTAAPVTVSGRVVDHNGGGISSASLVIEGGGLQQPRIARTSPFGYYSFDDLEIGTYTVTVQSRRYVFAVPSRTFSLRDNIKDFDFVAEPLE